VATARAAPRPRRAAQRRMSILRAAAVAMSSIDVAAKPVRLNASAAGISKLIIYRHFDSKEALYRAILDEVSARLAADFAAAVEDRGIRGVPSRVFLAAARDDPDGFRLLWHHSTREPQFSAYAASVRAATAEVARGFLAPALVDPVVLAWAAHVVVAHLVEASLLWVDHGDAAGDPAAADRIGRSIRALVRAWSEASTRAEGAHQPR
jgi:AcrR family transcriptional regulator